MQPIEYKFTTEVIGLQCQVKGTIHHDGFDIDHITHKGEMMDANAIKPAVLDAVCKSAIEDALENLDKIFDPEEVKWQQQTT
jgi:hypothetical protein